MHLNSIRVYNSSDLVELNGSITKMLLFDLYSVRRWPVKGFKILNILLTDNLF